MNDRKIRSVEDLFVYQKAREFSRHVGELIKKLKHLKKRPVSVVIPAVFRRESILFNKFWMPDYRFRA